MGQMRTLGDIVRAAIALGVEEEKLTVSEQLLMDQHGNEGTAPNVDELRAAILCGDDPLGDAYAEIMSPADRRPLGQTYTPAPIIESMLAWAQRRPTPARIVDPGAGSGRYLLAAARAFPGASLIALEIDALSGLMLRANIRAAGFSDRATVVIGDYRSAELGSIDSPTLFIGNPPYVRHHQIDPEWKDWLVTTAASHGLRASKLAGLHIHFFLATAQHARPGDYGAFITSSEWMDVNYGSVLRELLLDSLGGTEIHVIDPTAETFADATTTGAITCFEVGIEQPSMRLRRVESVSTLGGLGLGAEISRARLSESSRWSVLLRTAVQVPEGHIQLGELCRVHRGTVTGANAVWVARPGAVQLPESVLYPSITKARELFSAGARLTHGDALRQVIDLPVDLDVLSPEDRKLVNRFIRTAKQSKVQDGYVAANRRAWWSVGLRKAAPILATYMARRPPAFVLNDVEARHINIAHGLYPREDLSPQILEALALHLRSAVQLSQGRTYAGGLTKFEPREMERLTIPDLSQLQAEVKA
ncbi:methyltransferase [Agreia sp. COWG]|uniref:Eco57I restriction-modification methylase domain-containing protein n=1 Tax=Agreia sp. COWG TaxID=2773266 RepID=UPI001925DE65|nr:methyltransferase [Agreia sp. COWG]